MKWKQMEQTAFFYKPPFWKIFLIRLRHKLISNGEHPELKPLPEKFTDAIVLTTRTEFDLKDRIRILFGGKAETRVTVATVEKIGSNYAVLETSLAIN